MKRLFFLLIIYAFAVTGAAQHTPFRFAFISDTHIGSPNGSAEEDLRRTVADINGMQNIAFVVITGDITELGTNKELKAAKKILDSLHVTYYIIPGNHDTGWSESGGLSFTTTFGDDKFLFTYNGIHFIGCASGPYVRMSDGHVPRNAMNWMKEKLALFNNNERVIFLNHYPLDNGLDNWYEVIDMLKQKNTVLALCGHGHANRLVAAEGIPAVMGRSNLRAKAAAGGYNLVDVRLDSFLFTERNPVTKEEKLWQKVLLKKQGYDTTKGAARPDFSINQRYPGVKPVWTFSSEANVISTPAIADNYVVFGNQAGEIQALQIKDGKKRWSFKTGGPVFSSPAVAQDKIVIGSADGSIYCLTTAGKLAWKVITGASVLGSPLIEKNIVYIGGSDGSYRAIDLQTGKLRWRFDSLGGPVVSKPVSYNNTLVFGAWDRHLYAVNKETGTLLWKWNNGSPVINYSPAACLPVIHKGVVYIAAPDRYLSAIDIATGNTLWRTNEATVRESIGISEDGNYIYGKTMNDTIVAFYTNRDKPAIAWKLNAGFGYEHTPSVLLENKGILYFGTKNGIVYAATVTNPKITWGYKIDNSMVNTVTVLHNKQVIASTMDGKVCLLQSQ